MKPSQIAKKEKNITDHVLMKVTEFQKAGAIALPKDYSPENALKFAYLQLIQTNDKNGKPVLETCTKDSIANTLLDMVVQGLNPMKKQCYFIAYGNKLQLSRSYQGTIAIAKRTGLKNIVANIIYEEDKFGYEIDPESGLKKIINHTQDISNIDINKIKGAYAVTTMQDGTRDVEIMTILQIKKAWLQGAANGNSKAHLNFTDEMCKKTVITRACKGIINSSDDSYLFDDNRAIESEKEDENKIEIGFEQNAIESQEEQEEEVLEIQKEMFNQKPDF